MASEPRVDTILIGLSGPSSSGKTTLARLLREIFNRETEGLKITLAILHQDDFYKTDKDIPNITVSSAEHGTRDLQDWDCVDSLDLPLFENTLKYLRDHGSLPPDSVSKEDQNSVGDSGIPPVLVTEYKYTVEEWMLDLRSSDQSRREIRIYIVDGFLLYPPPLSSSTTQNNTYPHTQKGLDQLHKLTHTLLHPKLFLPSTREQTLTRRAARSGYVTLEGFWTDPPGYVEDVVWPNYVRYYSWMYKDNNVEGKRFDQKACDAEGVKLCPGEEIFYMEKVLEWAVDRVKEAVKEKMV